VWSESQKGIVIGKSGRKLSAIGRRARRSRLGGPVYLELWVKVRPKWSRRDRDLEHFGYKR
jgi:GTP-binding protein Era